MEVLDFIINGGETVRFHTWPVLRPQRVDSHSWGVAMLCAVMAQDEVPGLSVPLIMAALCHDVAEHKMGDLSAPVKRSLPAINGVSFKEYWAGMEAEILATHELEWEYMLSERDKRILKLADVMEGALYCIRERMMGNKLIATPFSNFRQYIRDLQPRWSKLEPHPEKGTQEDYFSSIEYRIIHYIDDMWEQANG